MIARVPPIILATLLAVAGGASAGIYASSALDASGSDGLDSELVGLYVQALTEGAHVQGFSLAGQMMVEEDYRNRTGSGSSPLERPEGTRTMATGEVHLTSTAIGSSFVLFARGDEASATINSDAWTLAHDAPDSVEEPLSPPSQRQPLVVNTRVSAVFSTLQDVVEVEVTGSFVLGLWDFSGIAQVGDQSVEVWSGSEEDLDPTATDGAVRDRVAKIYVIADDATLRITVPVEALRGLYLGSATASAEEFVLRNATLLGAAEAAPQDVTLVDATLDLEATGDTIEVTVQDEPGSTDGVPSLANPVDPPKNGDPEPETIVHAPVEGAPAWLTWSLGGLLALAVLALVAYAAKQRRQRLIEALRDAMEFGVFDAVTEAAPRLFRNRALAPEAAMMHVAATLQVKGPDAARRALAALPGRAQLARAAELYVQSCIDAQGGAAQEAEAELEACLALDESYEDEAAQNPFLQPILHRLRSRAAPSDGTEFA